MRINRIIKETEMKPIKLSGKFPSNAIPSTYYTLYIDWNNDGNFTPVFGDWFKYVVRQELIDSYMGETFKIIETMEINNG